MINTSNSTNTPESTNIIDLEYLMNPAQYTKYLEKTSLDASNNLALYKSNKKFYRRRLLQLTRDLLNGKEINGEIDHCFNIYITSCIAYLQFLDKRDILQEAFVGEKGDDALGTYKKQTEHEIISDGITKINNANDLLLIEKKPSLTTNYVKIKKKTAEPPIEMPKKKNINLKYDKIIKKLFKRLNLKKNINNVYEEKSKTSNS
jgi:hypothetical protein